MLNAYSEVDLTQTKLEHEIHLANIDTTVDAIIVQLPLPDHLNTQAALQELSPSKDVDNLTNMNTFVSPMVQAVQALIDSYNLKLEHQHIAAVGYGRLVGQPIATWLQSRGHAVTIIDEHTAEADSLIQKADILFAGTGQKHRVNANNTREGQIIFDCSGVDVDFETVKEKCQAITPPKGSIGPLTVHFLFMNALQTVRNRKI